MVERIDVLMGEFSDLRYDGRIFKEAKTLSEQGLRVRVLGFRKDASIAFRYKRGGVEYVEYPIVFGHGWLVRKGSLLLAALRLWVSAILTSARVYHAHNIFVLLPFLLAAKVFRSRFLIYDSHEFWSEYTKSFFRGVIRILERVALSLCDGLLTTCHFGLQKFRELYRLPISEFLLNCPVYVSRWSGERKRMRKLLGYRPNDFVVIFQGGFYHSRGLMALVKATSLLRGVKLLLVGFDSCGMKEEMEQQIEDLDIGDRVSIIGPVPMADLWRYTSAADVGYCGVDCDSFSYRYSCPNKLFEYLHAGLPIIFCGEQVLVSEVLGGTQKVILDLHPESITAAISYFQHNLRERLKASLESKKLGLKYTWQIEERKLLSLYRSMGAILDLRGSR